MLILHSKRRMIVWVLRLLSVIASYGLFSDLDQQALAGAHRNTNRSSLPEKDNMVCIPPGTFLMGCEEASFIDTRPIHKVRISGFWMDKTLVTNQKFADFVRATHYITIAERKPLAKDFPGAPPEKLVPGALVFTAPKHRVSLGDYSQWWRYVPGANWKHPEGPASNINKRWNHPVVQVAYDDALAYAHWAGKRLPTEAEFEYAARGGLQGKQFSWGDDLKPGGKWLANIWQGNFPSHNSSEDGFYSTAPVASFPANGYGLYDMTGNVWEWCSDWYHADYYKTFAPGKIATNPKGPGSSYDPYEPGTVKRVQRGGSFLCSDQYCARYLVGARGKGEPSSGCSNVGFRCASGVKLK
jgi:formylglycine-generating enzyme